MLGFSQFLRHPEKLHNILQSVFKYFKIPQKIVYRELERSSKSERRSIHGHQWIKNDAQFNVSKFFKPRLKVSVTLL